VCLWIELTSIVSDWATAWLFSFRKE